MKFREPNTVFDSEPNAAGDQIVPTFTKVFRKDGSWYLEQTGEKNVQEEIDSYKETTDYTKMLEAMERGDPVAEARAASIITANQMQYPEFVDDSASPDLRQIADAMILARNVYDREGLAKKGISFDQFMTSFDIQMKAPAAPAPAPAPAPVPTEGEVKKNEEK